MRALNPFRAKTPRTAKGERIYAVGDVHGRRDLLGRLLKIIADHYPTQEPRPRKALLLLLGDVIDRGPASARCLSKVITLASDGTTRMLLGNHEDMLLASLDGNSVAQEAWLRHGGLATLASYGIDPPAGREDAFDFAERLRRSIPDRHIAFLRSLETSYRSGSYFFAHAGVRPGVALARQEPEDLYSIRSEFTESRDWHGAVVVHGHSIVDSVDLRENRIACDTGAYETGKLSCVCLQDDTVTVLST